MPDRDNRIRWGVLLGTTGEIRPRVSLRDASRYASMVEREIPGAWAWIMRQDGPSGVWINPGTGYTARELLAAFRTGEREVLL